MNLRNALGTFGVTVAMGVVVLTTAPAAIAGTASAPTVAVKNVETLTEYASGSAAPLFCRNTYLRSRVSRLFVTAEVGSSNMLRARAAGRGDWEKFELCLHSPGYSTLRAVQNNRYVTAELSYTGAETGMLRARSDSVGDWEKFDVSCSPAPYCTLRSRANGEYVSAELDYPGDTKGMLRARSNSIGEWEQFLMD